MSVATPAALDLVADPRAQEGAIHSMFDRPLCGVRELTLRGLGWTVVIVALFTLWSTIPNVVAADGLRPALRTWVKYLPGFSATYALWIVPAMIMVGVADNLPLAGVRRSLALAAALALAAFSSAVATLYVKPCVVGDCSALSLDWRSVTQLTRRAIDVFAYTSAIAVAFFSLRRDRTIAAALH